MVSGGRGGGAGLWHLLVGPPLRARDVARQQISSVEGLPALSLDALTSVAYGPEAIIVVIAVAGAGALHLVLPITIAIVVLLAILVFSYRQVIDAYPGGGGAYAVSRATSGRAPACSPPPRWSSTTPSRSRSRSPPVSPRWPRTSLAWARPRCRSA